MLCWKEPNLFRHYGGFLSNNHLLDLSINLYGKTCNLFSKISEIVSTERVNELIRRCRHCRRHSADDWLCKEESIQRDQLTVAVNNAHTFGFALREWSRRYHVTAAHDELLLVSRSNVSNALSMLTQPYC